jgi:hypothetical protein
LTIPEIRDMFSMKLTADIVEEFMITSAPTKAVIVEPKTAYKD